MNHDYWLYPRIRTYTFSTQKFTTVIVITSNKHQTINTSPADKIYMAEILCSCFWAKQGCSFQLNVPTLLLCCLPFICWQFGLRLVWPPSTVLSSVTCGLCCTLQVPAELWRRHWARITCQEDFLGLETFLFSLLPILKSWCWLNSLTYFLPEPTARTQML